MAQLVKYDGQIILGSSSPRRQQMLADLGVSFTVVKPETEERIKSGELPRDYVLRNAREKAEWVFEKKQSDGDILVISADTIVVSNGQVMEKPKSESDAEAMLMKLSGSRHEVISSFCMIKSDKGGVKQTTHAETTFVKFVDLSAEDCRYYISTGEPMDKAGSYGIQGIGGFMVKSIEGSYSNVVGLPLAEFLVSLRSLVSA
ncbi:Maf family protein [Pseudobacteriovorax antillogorgiicola]|uniref:dTTP/UTP pyrophosphatase n=1 Tax=Pseudobacteriovorax antillogorgiicola TaxID=1513793 RepID=A0A1Y6BWW1_9BACT|nr:Maf family protein [Pseudobacteriovorax antillogorgiicola]TCS50262.1 septum formation protein [Pseudobacteriovorax antillogorgiicola]SMF33319.1 septum formation protein [Pseudobacteriovorax antillogorgiicola]